jgi:hypothetical protein
MKKMSPEYIRDPLGHSAELEANEGKIVVRHSTGGNHYPERRLLGIFRCRKQKANPVDDIEKRLEENERTEFLKSVRFTRRLTDWREQY